LTACQWTVFATCVTALVVSVLDWSRLWWFVRLAVFAYLLGAGGLPGCAARFGLGAHGLGGSHAALVTALLVVSVRDVSTTAEIVAWVLPAAVGVPLIVRAHSGARAHVG
jgi:hypothetical protein